jgi:hypothetical protein
MAAVKVTLARAHKVADRLSKQIGAKRAEISNALRPVRMTGFGGNVEQVQAMVARAGAEIVAVRRLSGVLFEVRTAIGKVNHQVGVDVQLAKLEFVRQELKQTQDLVNAYLDPALVFVADLAGYRQLTENTGYTREVGVLVGKLSQDDLALLRQNIRVFERDSARLQDELAAINATAQVELDLPDDVALELGLIDPPQEN